MATDESLLYGAYNMLLTYLFPPQDHYVVTPQLKRPPEGWSTNLSTIFIVKSACRPVFFLEIKPHNSYIHRSTRAAADSQMRAGFFDLIDDVDLPALHGVSALGTRLCFYKYQSSDTTLTPTAITLNLDRMNDVAPASRWELDLLSDLGEAKMRQVTKSVKIMVSQK